MANRQRAEARRKAAAKAARGGGGGGGGSAPWLWIGVALAAVVAVVLVVVLVTGGGDDDPAAGDTTVATNPASNFPDSQPVEVDGDALFTYNPDAPLDEAVGVTAPILVGKNFQGDTITVDAAANGATMLVFLVFYLAFPRRRRMLAVAFAAVAVVIYYWFKLPVMFGLQGDGSHALLNLRGVLAGWWVWPLRVVTSGLLMALLLARKPRSGWSGRVARAAP